MMPDEEELREEEYEPDPYEDGHTESFEEEEDVDEA